MGRDLCFVDCCMPHSQSSETTESIKLIGGLLTSPFPPSISSQRLGAGVVWLGVKVSKWNSVIQKRLYLQNSQG